MIRASESNLVLPVEPRRCFEVPARSGAPTATADPDDEAARRDRGELLLCCRCRAPITDASARVEVSGQNEHYFANPHGYDFHIGCFAVAPGCIAHGPATGEFTWFPGHAWQLAACTACTLHLGWRFRSPRQDFFGLILDRLVAGRPDGEAR